MASSAKFNASQLIHDFSLGQGLFRKAGVATQLESSHIVRCLEVQVEKIYQLIPHLGRGRQRSKIVLQIEAKRS